MFAESTRTKKNVGAGIANICGICIIRKKAAPRRQKEDIMKLLINTVMLSLKENSGLLKWNKPKEIGQVLKI